MARVFLLPAAVLSHIGALVMLSTYPPLRWIGLVGAIVCVACAASVSPTLFTTSLLDLNQALSVMSLLVIAGCAIHLYGQRPPWLVLMTLGAALPLMVQVFVSQAHFAPFYSDTMAAAAMLYVFPLGLAWVALPALMTFTRPIRLPILASVATAFAIWVALAPWVGAMLVLGRQGMPLRYIDYPMAFADLNWFVSRAVVAFALTYLGALTLIRRLQA